MIIDKDVYGNKYQRVETKFGMMRFNMKPPIDWSPCQQKGKEHHWEKGKFIEEPIWSCWKCGVILRGDLDYYGPS